MASKQLDSVSLTDEQAFPDAGRWVQAVVRPAVKLMAAMGLSPDLVWLAAGFFTLVSGFFFVCTDFFLGFFFLLLQTYLELCGNFLVEKHPPTLMGEYFNEILDFMGLLFISFCIANVAFESFRLIVVLFLWASLLFQNSYREYFYWNYLKELNKRLTSLSRPLDGEAASFKLLIFLRKFYLYTHTTLWKTLGWIDNRLHGPSIPTGWYQDRWLLSRQSYLRRPFQWILLALLTWVTDLGIGVLFFLILSNAYWFSLMAIRVSKFRTLTNH